MRVSSMSWLQGISVVSLLFAAVLSTKGTDKEGTERDIGKSKQGRDSERQNN